MKLIKEILILMVGLQGSGKGTQSALLADRLKLKHFVAGDYFREIQKEESDIGRKVKERLDKGQIMTIELWDEVVGQQLRLVEDKSMILDGVLRSIEQVEIFEKIQAKKNWPQILILNLKVPRQVSVDRLLKRGRHDDTPQQISTRLDWSEQEMKPVLEHYRAKNQVIDINANQPVQDVEAEINQQLVKLGLVEND